MAYCNHCGAYIPDGQEICLACGFDPKAEAQRAAEAQATAYAYQEKAEERAADARAEVERRRAERKESDRAWAENERRRRQMEEEFRRAQEEKEKRAESYVHRDAGKRVSVDIGGRRYTFHAQDADAVDEESEEETRDLGDEIREAASRSANKGMGVLSYLGILVFIPLLFGSEDRFVKFHSKQGLKLFCYTALGSAIGSFVGVGWVATLLGAVLAIKGVISALNGKMEELPILKKLKWF